MILLLTFLASSAQAQFQFFEQMFQGGGGGGHQQHQQQQAQNVPSDSKWYQETYEQGKPPTSPEILHSSYIADSVQLATCDNYLCPGTLACVHFPHHCPCAWPAVEDKVELAEGSALCISKGGYKAGEAARKIELARKGLI